GIETSCDETGIGIVAGTNLLAHQVASSMDEHAAFGGVIPEIAARAHVADFLPGLDPALARAQVSLHDVEALAGTAGRRHAGALAVGVAGAKALALATGKPLYGINHLIAHIGVGYLDASGADLSNVNQLGALLVSGGHTEMLKINSLTSDVELLGGTIDDAA